MAPPVQRGRRAGLWVTASVVIATLAGVGIWFYQGRETALAEVAKTGERSGEEVPVSPSPPSNDERGDTAPDVNPIAPAIPTDPVSPSEEPSPLEPTPVITEDYDKDKETAESALEKKRSPPEIKTAERAGSARQKSPMDMPSKKPPSDGRSPRAHGYSDKQQRAIREFNDM
jgi:uncharacterized iron-regulated membrane protein